jgi:hypothetical protein
MSAFGGKADIGISLPMRLLNTIAPSWGMACRVHVAWSSQQSLQTIENQ